MTTADAAGSPGGARRCFIHIGTPKTGSTSIQLFLAENRARLHELGIFVPSSAGTAGDPSTGHHAVVSDLLGQAPVATGGFASVMAELAATDLRDACVSSENFSLLYDRPDLLQRLRDGVAAAGFTPIIVAFLRPQASYATAVFALNVLDGYRARFDAYLDDIIERGRYLWSGGFGPQFDYVQLLDGFAAVFGHDAVRALRFTSDAPDGALMRALVGAMRPSGAAAALRMPARRANRTLTFGAVLALLDVPNDFDEHLRFAPLDLADLARVQRRFGRVNGQLRERYGLRLPVVEPLDIVRAAPLRRSLRLTRELRAARRALRSGPSTAHGPIDASSCSSVNQGL